MRDCALDHGLRVGNGLLSSNFLSGFTLVGIDLEVLSA